jgi:hypothetical protein
MIYQFRSKAAPDVIMLADLTQQIFDILGHPVEPRGILTIEKLPTYITALETAILKDLEERLQTKNGANEHQGHSKSTYRLGQRAYPFLELMKQSNAKGEPVMWGV